MNEKQAARERPFDELKDILLPVVATLRAEEKARDTAQQIAVDLVNNKDLNAVAQKYGVEVKDTPFIQQGQEVQELSSEFQRRIFATNKGEIGTALPITGVHAIPMLTEIAPAHAASYEEASSKVIEDVKAEKARTLATDKGKQAQELIKGGKDLAAAAKAVGAEIKTSELLNRGANLPDYGPIVDLEKEMFSLPIGKAGTPQTVAGKTVAFSVKQRQEVKPEDVQKSAATLRTELVPIKREQYFGAYIQEVRKKMDANGEIKVNEAVMTQIAQTSS